MPTRPLLVLLGLALPAVTLADEAENWQRLRSMPRERRVFLAEKMRDFDRLTREEKDAVRELDRKLNTLDASDRANYGSVLRRYHLWLQSLSEDQRKDLENTPPDQRLAKVEKLRAQGPPKDSRQGALLSLHLADLNGPSPFEWAYRIRGWLELNPAQKAEIEKLPAPERQGRVFSLVPKKPHRGRRHLTESEAEDLLKKMDADPQLRGMLLNPLKNSLKDKEKHNRARHRLAENYYFLVHPPDPVEGSNLLLFESAMPSWYRVPFDHLPPGEARRRLTILYRLIYASPEEIPAPKAPGANPPAGPQASTSAPDGRGRASTPRRES